METSLCACFDYKGDESEEGRPTEEQADRESASHWRF